RLTEAELPAVSPLEFLITRGDGRPGLDVREGEFEQVYGVDDMLLTGARNRGYTVKFTGEW
ncbi:MAG: hypothetical protein ABIQ16_26320, partial [Polyangiaceae bacterium]